MRLGLCVCLLISFFVGNLSGGVALANQAPVEEASGVVVAAAEGSHASGSTTPAPASTPSVTANMSVEQRIARLETQANNIAKMNLPQQMSDLQQQFESISGQLQVQQHDLKLLNDQQLNFYKDLNQRIDQIKNLVSNSGDSSNGSSAKPASADNHTGSSNGGLALKESTLYQKAFNLLTERHYEKAQAAFSQYLNVYPNGKYDANAHYWLGEIYLIQKDNKNAMSQFEAVINKYPKSNKVADAKLKLAMVHINQNKKKLATKELQMIKTQYKGTTAAQLASIQLEQLQTEALE